LECIFSFCARYILINQGAPAPSGTDTVGGVGSPPTCHTSVTGLSHTSYIILRYIITIVYQYNNHTIQSRINRTQIHKQLVQLRMYSPSCTGTRWT